MSTKTTPPKSKPRKSSGPVAGLPFNAEEIRLLHRSAMAMASGGRRLGLSYGEVATCRSLATRLLSLIPGPGKPVE